MAKHPAMTTGQYEQVRVRDCFRCTRCNAATMEGAWHHRRGKAVRDEHTHCSCNGVWLCHPCHLWAHGPNLTHARTAMDLGFRVSRIQIRLPYQTPILTAQRGWVLFDCTGGYKECDDPFPAEAV